jgi:TPR repeat protein
MHLSRARQKLIALLHNMPRLLVVSFGLALVLGGLSVGVNLSSSVRADSYEGLQSYEQGRKDESIHLLRRAAWQENDLFAQLKLGEIYSTKSESDKGYRDPVEAAVWYYLALLNVTIGENLYYQPVIDKLSTRINDAQTKLQEIYNNLLQDERIDLRNRVTYIEACRGPDGLILLGQLHDHRFERTTLYLPPGNGNNDVGRGSEGEDYWSQNGPSGSYYPSQSYGSGTLPSFRSPLYGEQQPIEKSDLEAKLFYKLAEIEGYPYAREYLEGITDSSGYSEGPIDPKKSDLQARAKADRWLSPFEFYAAETRYRGELPSGLVLSDECPVNNAREKALQMGKQLIPPTVLFEMLDFLGFSRGFSLREMPRAVSKYQDFLGEPQTGELTPIQVVRLIQIAAVRGHKKAQRCLGIMYIKGVGVVRNLVRAEKWLLAAAEQSDGEAMYALSELYSLGGRGIEKSEDKANRYRQGSAVSGFAPVRSEFLRLLETAPPQDQAPRPPRRHYRRSADEPSTDE